MPGCAPVAELVDAADSKSADRKVVPVRFGPGAPHCRARVTYRPGPIEARRPVKFCSNCGQAVALRTLEGDHLPRFICDGCGTVHYQNPKLVVGCVPEYDGRILLCRRAIEPRHGFWTIPAGFMENDETTQEGARRESQEEALADVEIGSLLAIVHVLHADQVHVMFRARLAEPRYGAGAESLEVKLVTEAEIPWQDIAFRSVDFALRKYFEDRRRGVEEHHFTALDYRKSPVR
jgi:ADP-ribose pyrophosphatase YjhB (NUDIX family)